jgi:hypothetical protein
MDTLLKVVWRRMRPCLAADVENIEEQNITEALERECAEKQQDVHTSTKNL